MLDSCGFCLVLMQTIHNTIDCVKVFSIFYRVDCETEFGLKTLLQLSILGAVHYGLVYESNNPGKSSFPDY